MLFSTFRAQSVALIRTPTTAKQIEFAATALLSLSLLSVRKLSESRLDKNSKPSFHRRRATLQCDVLYRTRCESQFTMRDSKNLAHLAQGSRLNDTRKELVMSE